jgi:hypothetical protein
MVLQHVHDVSILICLIVVDEGFFRLRILLGGPPFFLFDMFFTTRRGSRT